MKLQPAWCALVAMAVPSALGAILSLARSVSAGASPPNPDKESRDLHNELAAAPGDAFDRLFIRNAVSEIEKTRAVRSFVASDAAEITGNLSKRP
jgi:hypothetical protein